MMYIMYYSVLKYVLCLYYIICIIRVFRAPLTPHLLRLVYMSCIIYTLYNIYVLYILCTGEAGSVARV